jgi:hypothetical protein
MTMIMIMIIIVMTSLDECLRALFAAAEDDDAPIHACNVGLYWLGQEWCGTLAENPVRHIETLREMEAHKRQYQIRCSHHELELLQDMKTIICVVCGKQWVYAQERGYRDPRKVFSAEKDC